MHALLEVASLSAGYKNKKILHNLNFSLEQGQHLALLGPNGSGKTTLLRCLAGSIRPTSGTIVLNGKNIMAMKSIERARIIAATPQNASRPPGLKVGQFTLLGRYPWLSWTGFFSPADHEAANLALKSADLADFIDREVSSLSGGEWQRAILARALAQISGQPRPLLVMDELAAGLDLARAIEIFNLLDSRRENGFCMVSAMHDCNLAARYATHMLGLKNGRILFYGRTRDIFTKENLSALYGLSFGLFTHPELNLPFAYPRLRHESRPDCHAGYDLHAELRERAGERKSEQQTGY